LRKLEEMEIRREHDNLSKEQKDLTKLLGSEKLKSQKLIEEMQAVDAKFGLKTEIGKRRTEIAKAKEVEQIMAVAEEAAAIETAIEKEPITVVCSQKGWLRAFKGHQEPNDSIKYREGDRERFWLHAETTDKLMLFATDGRFFTLDCSKLPSGRGNGEAIRTFIDLPPDADLVEMFVHKGGRKILVASMTGHGFVTNEDDAVAMKRSGKQVLNVQPGVEAAAMAFVEGEQVAVTGENRKLLIFPLEGVPEMPRGKGVLLQRYKDGHLVDICTFVWKEGFKDQNNRAWGPSDLKDWKGERAQAGRIVPRGFASSLRFAD
jgi:topoisomerase-4 subunit A